jgi:hypothetical protein
VTLSEIVDSADESGNDKAWKADALEHIQSLNLPCSSYAKVILDFVLMYGGGANAPQIRFMDDFSKMFQCKVILGELYWTTVTNMQFQCKLTRYPLLRAALLLANLISPKVEDGIGKLLVKSDLTKLCTVKMLPVVKASEKILEDGQEIVRLTSTVEAAVKPLGQLFVRVALLATDKGDKGPEGKKFTAEEIKDSFIEAMSELVGQPITCDSWSGSSGTKAPAEEQAKPPAASKVHSLDDHKNPQWIAEQAGFTVGMTVSEKGSSIAFAIFDIGEKVQLQQLYSYSGKVLKISVDLLELLNKWSRCSANPPVEMEGGQQRPSLDLHKTAIYMAVRSVEPKAEPNIVFWRRPDEVRSSSKMIGKGQLTLVPVAPLINIVTRQSPKAIPIHKVGDVQFYILEPTRPPFVAKDTKFPADAIICGFWWVGTTHRPEEANMELTHIDKHGISVPVLQNFVDIQPFTKLCRYKEKQEQAPALSTVTVLEGSLDSSSGMSAGNSASNVLQAKVPAKRGQQPAAGATKKKAKR